MGQAFGCGASEAQLNSNLQVVRDDMYKQQERKDQKYNFLQGNTINNINNIQDQPRENIQNQTQFSPQNFQQQMGQSYQQSQNINQSLFNSQVNGDCIYYNNNLNNNNYNNSNNNFNSNNMNQYQQFQQPQQLFNNQNDLQRSQNLNQYEKRKQYLASIVNQAATLTLRVISSASLQKGQMININAQGLQESDRMDKDGNVYFGTVKYEQYQNENGILIDSDKIQNDFILPCVDEETNQKHIGRHFQIYFDEFTHMYNIQDFGLGLGVFLKLVQPILLKQLKIGRSSKNDIFFEEDVLLSKIHCYIQFDFSNYQWYLLDNKSTNGTWIYLQDPLVIESGMIFKCNQTIFQAIVS
ncbi:SMAD/FHA domain [Pseudocohnilembus persalinus]|uniref:SMAD/FHA domain n=1 Tax=Pseudocohnilembus persalinus TaxID=266149 RepID=A0A0V0QIS4_PSEPJ|nr:SMAD/FHA domain [Pseudocohnilembus persalinus]|eukprot:KRX02054.1 SMAD/FHA domain [Pseudocohnilembus persalinus]